MQTYLPFILIGLLAVSLLLWSINNNEIIMGSDLRKERQVECKGHGKSAKWYKI
ncbi:MAG: hypothetical protein AABY79_00570 [Nitrospirota bacterium]|jgi:hypothetical protein